MKHNLNTIRKAMEEDADLVIKEINAFEKELREIATKDFSPCNSCKRADPNEVLDSDCRVCIADILGSEPQTNRNKNSSGGSS